MHSAVRFPLLQSPIPSNSKIFCEALLQTFSLLCDFFFFLKEASEGKDCLFLHISTALDMMLLAGYGISCSVWELVRYWAKCSEVAPFCSKCVTTRSESFIKNIQKVHAGSV